MPGLSQIVLMLIVWPAVAVAGAGAFTAGQSWDWQLTEPFDMTRDVAVMDIDPDNHDPAEIAALTARGIATICYVSVGTLEDWRDDVDAFPPDVVGRTYGDWPDERFLDIRRLDILVPIMQARIARCAALGFDGVEPDNMDVYDNASGFPLTEDDAVTYIRALADTAHRLGLAIGQKNAPGLTPALISDMDFAITEGCAQDGWCSAMSPYIAAGKPVFAAEYTDRPLDVADVCAQSASLGLSTIIKDRDLTATRRGCPE